MEAGTVLYQVPNDALFPTLSMLTFLCECRKLCPSLVKLLPAASVCITIGVLNIYMSFWLVKHNKGKREKKAILFFRAATKERLSKIVVCVYPQVNFFYSKRQTRMEVAGAGEVVFLCEIVPLLQKNINRVSHSLRGGYLDDSLSWNQKYLQTRIPFLQ